MSRQDDIQQILSSVQQQPGGATPPPAATQGSELTGHQADIQQILGSLPKQQDLNVAPEGAAPNNAPPEAGPDNGAFMAGVDNFNRMFGRVAEGTMSLLAGAVGANDFKAKTDNYTTQQDMGALQSYIHHPIASNIGTGTGILAAAIPMMMAGGGIPASIGTGTALGFLNAAPTMNDRLKNGAIGGVLGAAVPYAVKGWGNSIGRAKNAILGSNTESGLISKIFNPGGAALKDAAHEIQASGGMENVASRVQPFNDLGVQPTMTQAVGSPNLSNLVAKIPNNAATTDQIKAFIQPQSAELQAAAKSTLDNFVPKGIADEAALRQANYAGLTQKAISDESLQALKTNSSIADRLKALSNNTDSQVKDLPDGNMAKLDALKQDIDSQIWNKTLTLKDGERPMSPDERGTLLSARNQIVQAMDEANPEYAAIRQQSERVIMYNKFSSLLNKQAPKPGENIVTDNPHPTDNISLDQFQKVLFGNTEKQQYLLDAVKSAGGDPKNTSDLMKVLNMIKGSPEDSLSGKAYSSTVEPKFGEGMVNSALKNLFKGNYNDELLKLNFSGKAWQEQVKNAINNPGNLTRLTKNLLELLDKIKNSTVAQTVGKLVTQGAGATGLLPHGDLIDYSPGKHMLGIGQGVAITKGVGLLGHHLRDEGH